MYVVDGVIPLNILAQSWMWWCFSLIPIILISPLILALLSNLIVVFIFVFMIVLIKTVCGWSSITTGNKVKFLGYNRGIYSLNQRLYVTFIG
jgi:hypothetical protein